MRRTIVTVHLPAGSYRWALDPTTAVDALGDELAISAGLMRAEVDSPGEDAPPGVSIEWDPAPLDLAELAAAGSDLADATVELARLEDGEAWEDREVLVYGRVGDCSYGGLGDKATAQAGSSWDDRGLLPPVDAQVADLAGTVRTMPWIIGRPPSAPAIVYSLDSGGLALIAGHPVVATAVLARDGGGPWTSCNVVQVPLGGRIVSIIPLDPWVADVSAAEIEVDWSASEGGHRSVTGPGPARSLRDAIAVVLAHATVPIDRASLADLARLDGLRVDTWLTEPASPVNVASDMLAGMPAELEAGPRGLRVVLDPMWGELRALRAVDLDGADGEALGFDVEGVPPPDVVVVKYRPDRAGAVTAAFTLLAGQGPRQAVRLGRARAAEVGVGELQVDRRQASRLRPAITKTTRAASPGPTPALELTAPHVADPGTAAAMATHAMRAGAARRAVRWEGPDLGLQVGDRVELTSSRLWLEDAAAVVVAVERGLDDGTAEYAARLIG